MKEKILVVGAGFSGCTFARMMADNGLDVTIIDKRSHIGGNAFDEKDRNGVLIHPYGPHIFHTNSKRVIEFLSRFTTWRFYEHRVLAEVEGSLYPIPINRTTINKLYSLSLDEAATKEFLERVRVPLEQIKTSEDVVLSCVGNDLCEKFFRGYTKKQWGLDLSQLSAGVAARIPTRTDDDDRYFSDTYQMMPAEGYTRMFERILDDERISVKLGLDFDEVRTTEIFTHTVYTGPIDAYFKHCHGRLPYRSLRFEHNHIEGVNQVQNVGTVNYPNDHEYTRITEFKHLTGQLHSGTSIVKEYPQSEGDPYYPIPRPENESLYKKYEAMADEERNVTFVGRLAQYRYYNMDQVVAAALNAAEKFLSK